MPPSSTVVHNIILFGESGSGKSSIVNMMVGQPVAEVSSSLLGCTFKHESYATSIDNTSFRIYDTVGLNEGDQGRVPHWKAVQQLYTLVRSLEGVSLLIYCMRGRIKESTPANWLLFHKVLCREQVPIIAVVTGLEQEEQEQLDRKGAEIKKAFKAYGMVPEKVEWIVPIRGRNEEHEALYDSSRRRLRDLIKKSYRRKPWTTHTDEWIAQIYTTTYTTKLCILPDIEVEFTQSVGKVVDEFIEKSQMQKGDSDQLKATILQAEKKLLKVSKKNKDVR